MMLNWAFCYWGLHRVNFKEYFEVKNNDGELQQIITRFLKIGPMRIFFIWEILIELCMYSIYILV